VTAPPAPPPRREPEPPRERQVARAPEPAPRAAPPPRVPEPAPQAAEPAPRAAAPRAPEASAPARPAERAPAAEPPREGAGPQVAALPPQGQAPGPDVKSLLRRGGGGAGGQAEGRGAVEGEPVPLDSRDPKYSDYLEQVRRKIKANWGYPCVKNDLTRGCDYKTTSLVIEFGIAKDGRVPFVTVLRSSGYPIYDDYAVNAVKLSSPFPPLPDAFGRRGIPIHATFSYVVEASLTNLLR
jgi:protein TonB